LCGSLCVAGLAENNDGQREQTNSYETIENIPCITLTSTNAMSITYDVGFR
jgi:hypothetical protein